MPELKKLPYSYNLREQYENINAYFVNGLDTIKKELILAQNNLVTTPNIKLCELKDNFSSTVVLDKPMDYDDYYQLLSSQILPYIVNVTSPKFIGHMTSVLPEFHYDLSKLISMLNQNMVKIETSKSLTFLEREALAMLHREFYRYPSEFYQEHAQNVISSLGIIVSGGTMANITALWVARNSAFPAAGTFQGIAEDGLCKAYEHYECKDGVILVSPLLHYSIEKAASILGIGKKQIHHIQITPSGTVDVRALRSQIVGCQKNRQRIIAIVGIAGSTENGSIDPLQEMAELAKEYGIYFHVDAAFGGPVIFSEKYKHLIDGIEFADSITLCGHKQLYLPIGISMCLFKCPSKAQTIWNTADYQASQESFDFGKSSPEGSRPAKSIYLHASLHVIGKNGYEYLINKGIENANYLKKIILSNSSFELVTNPTLNIVNYRYIPSKFRKQLFDGCISREENKQIDEVNVLLQTQQFENGKTFVSKTKVPSSKYTEEILTLRAVLANPLTTFQDIDSVIIDQLRIAEKMIERID
ncbi:MAG: Pyridoxal-dependent decarboxylase [Burkholderiales bacterium]|jgi:glutamate decarboxylase|nr:Pyridoxal-dependent decarboxylase [Burkholderiales bacterium]